MNNSYIKIDKELDAFALTNDQKAADYMAGADISWLSQVKPFIEQFSKRGDLVFDPFAGLGTTLLGAGITGRRSVGIEIDKHRFEQLQQRVAQHQSDLIEQPKLICGNALIAPYPDEVDLVMTNFPYFHTSPSLANGNVYSITDYESYLSTIERIIIRCKDVLKKEGYMLVFTENIRLANGNMLPQAYDICRLMQKHLNLKEERIVLYDKPATTVADPSYSNRSHEYVFIARQKTVCLESHVFRSSLQLLEKQIQYVIVGSYALSLLPEGATLDCAPADVDLFVSSVEEAIKAAHTLADNGYNVYSWNDLFDTSFEPNHLNGRYYLRAIREVDGLSYQIDINYESDIVNFENLYAKSKVVNGVRVADLDSISDLIRERNAGRDKRLLFRIDEFRSKKANI